MHSFVLDISDSEYELVKLKFNEKADALMKSQNKTWAVGNLPQANFKKIVINGRRYIVGARNIFMGVMEGVLLEAARNNPDNFGTRDANKVMDALYITRPVGERKDFDELVKNEQFALVFEVDENDIVSPNVLRLDLFRMIKKEKNDANKYEFIGGLLHALKHFVCDGLALSTNKENEKIDHPSQIIALIIETFFQSTHIPNGRGFEADYTINGKRYHMGFFKEAIADVHFLNTFYRNE